MPLTLIDPKTKQAVPVPEQDAVAAFKQGYVFPKGAQIPVVNQRGEIGTIDEKDASHAFNAGVRIASPDEVAAAHEEAAIKERRERLGAKTALGHVAEQYAADAASKLRGLTAGLSDVALLKGTEALAGKENADALRERLKFLEEEHPYTSGIGQAEGMAAPLLIPGGQAEAAGGLVRAGTSIPRGIATAGRAAEGLVEAATGGKAVSTVGRIAQGALKNAAAGATEGALYGAGQAASEAALGDHELTAEKVIAGATHEAIAWGLAGGALGGVGGAVGSARDAAGRFLQQLSAKDIGALAEKTFGVEAKGLGEMAKDFFTKAASLTTGEDAGAIRTLLERRHEIAEAPAIRANAAREVRTDLDALLDSSRELADEARGPLKAEYVRKAVARGNEELTTKAAADAVTTLSDDIAEMFVKPKEYGEKRLLSNAFEYLRGVRTQMDRIIKEGGEDVNAKLFTTLDDTKRAIGRWTKGLQAVERKADALELMKGRATRDRFQGFYEDLRKGLEDSELWGRAAEDQSRINAAWTKQIDAHRVFDARLTTNVGRDPKNPWVDIRRVDPAKADAYVSGLTNPNNDLVHTAIKNYVGSTEELAKAIGESYELPPGKIAHVERVAESAARFGQTVDKAADSLTLVNQFDALRKAQSTSGIAEAGALLGATGHPLMGMAGAAVDAVARPAQTIARLAALERFINKMDLRIGQSVRGFFRETPKALTEGGRAVSTASRSLGRSELLEQRRAQAREFDRKVARIQELANNPDLASARVAASLAGMDQDAPRTSGAIASQTARITAFLASKVPPGMQQPQTFGPKVPGNLVSDMERTRWLRYERAANDPKQVLSDFEHGRLTPEEVETMKACRPLIYEQMRREVMSYAIDHNSELPYGKRVSLGVLFEIPTDATLRPEFLQAIKGAGAADAKKEAEAMPGPPARELKVADKFQTTFEAVSQEREGAR